MKSVAECLLEKFPPFDATWSDDLKTKWFDAFATLIVITMRRLETPPGAPIVPDEAKVR